MLFDTSWTSSLLPEQSSSPVEVHSDTPDNLLDRFVGAAGKVEQILDSTCEPGLYAAQLEGCRLGLLHLRQVHFQEVLRNARQTGRKDTHTVWFGRRVDGTLLQYRTIMSVEDVTQPRKTAQNTSERGCSFLQRYCSVQSTPMSNWRSRGH